MRSFIVVFIPLLLVITFSSIKNTLAIGLCREDHVCAETPTTKGQICKCWSTCSPIQDARQCDKASPAYDGYEKEKISGSDVGCNYVPLVQNRRDLCVWYYDPDSVVEVKPTMPNQKDITVAIEELRNILRGSA